MPVDTFAIASAISAAAALPSGPSQGRPTATAALDDHPPQRGAPPCPRSAASVHTTTTVSADLDRNDERRRERLPGDLRGEIGAATQHGHGGKQGERPSGQHALTPDLRPPWTQDARKILRIPKARRLRVPGTSDQFLDAEEPNPHAHAMTQAPTLAESLKEYSEAVPEADRPDALHQLFYGFYSRIAILDRSTHGWPAGRRTTSPRSTASTPVAAEALRDNAVHVGPRPVRRARAHDEAR